MQRRDLSKALLTSATGVAFLPKTSEAQTCTPVCYPITAAETSIGVTPTNYAYPASPWVDPRRYGAKGDGVTSDTAAMQTALNVAKAGNGRVVLPENFNALCGALSLTFSGTRATQGFTIEGMSPNGSMITQLGTPTALLTIAGPAPTSTPSEVQLVLQNFTIQQAGLAKTADGIFLHGVANFRISNVIARGFNRAIYLFSSLIGQIDQGTQATDSHYGLYCRTDGTAVPCNLVTCRDAKFNLNDSWGIDYDGGTQFTVSGCDLEGNGVPANYATGGLAIRSHVAGTLGFALISINGVWFESNKGQTMLVESLGGNSFVSIENTQFLSEDAGHSLLVQGCNYLAIKNSWAPSPNAKWDLTASQSLLENSQSTLFTDTGVTSPTYINFATSTSNYSGVWIGRVKVAAP